MFWSNPQPGTRLNLSLLEFYALCFHRLEIYACTGAGFGGKSESCLRLQHRECASYVDRSDAARQATVAPSGARSALRLRAASASPSVSAMLWESCSSWRSHLSWARGSRNGSSKTAPAQAPHVGSGVPCVLPSPSLCLRWARRTGAGAGAREPPRALPQPSSREALRTWPPRWRPRSRVGSAACRLRALAPRGAPQS